MISHSRGARNVSSDSRRGINAGMGRDFKLLHRETSAPGNLLVIVIVTDNDRQGGNSSPGVGRTCESSSSSGNCPGKSDRRRGEEKGISPGSNVCIYTYSQNQLVGHLRTYLVWWWLVELESTMATSGALTELH